MTLTVANKYKIKPQPETDVYIGRGSPLGNPYPITDIASRDQVIAQYEEWLAVQIQENKPSVINALNNIAERLQQGQPVRLVCFCKPQRCHGDVLKRVIETALQRQS